LPRPKLDTKYELTRRVLDLRGKPSEPTEIQRLQSAVTKALNEPYGRRGARRKDNASLYYQLTSEEWLRACKELQPSEKDVLYYLRTLDPFGERDLDIGVREMARALGMSPSTVSRALAPSAAP
jgi:DNA-binding transcriptional ArsR family regulator